MLLIHVLSIERNSRLSALFVPQTARNLPLSSAQFLCLFHPTIYQIRLIQKAVLRLAEPCFVVFVVLFALQVQEFFALLLVVWLRPLLVPWLPL